MRNASVCNLEGVVRRETLMAVRVGVAYLCHEGQ